MSGKHVLVKLVHRQILVGAYCPPDVLQGIDSCFDKFGAGKWVKGADADDRLTYTIHKKINNNVETIIPLICDRLDKLGYPLLSMGIQGTSPVLMFRKKDEKEQKEEATPK
jgi:hypothetical protein